MLGTLGLGHRELAHGTLSTLGTQNRAHARHMGSGHAHWSTEDLEDMGARPLNPGRC